MSKSLLAVFFFVMLLFAQCKHEPEKITITNPPTNAKDSICFEEEVLPMLASNCAMSGCHDADAANAGVVLDSYDHLKATISGSLLLQSVKDTGAFRMPLPPAPALSSTQISVLENWVNQGMKIGIDCEGPCDTSNVTYSGVILPLLQNSCISCHSGNYEPDLTNYNQVKTQVNNGKLSGSVNHLPGYDAMPYNQAKLSDCKLAQIRIWIAAGAPNN